jgi:hypothetical protein
MEMKVFENIFPPYEDLQILGMLFTSHITPHTTLGNEKSLKLLLGVCKTKERGDLSISQGANMTGGSSQANMTSSVSG